VGTVDAIELIVLRRQAGLWQYQLAALLDLPQTVISDMERAKRPIAPEVADRIRRAIDEAKGARG